MMVKFVINYLGHDTDACSQVAEGVGEMLSLDRASDGGAAWVFLLHQERIEYSSTTLFRLLHDLSGGWCPLVSKNILDILGIRGYLHSVKKWYIHL